VENLISSDDNSDSEKGHRQKEGVNVDCDLTFEASCSSSESCLKTQGDLNDLVHDFNMSKKQAKLLGLRLKGWNILYQDTEICSLCNCQDEFKEFFSQENDLVFCNDDCSVIEALEHQHDPTEWCLYIDTR